MSAADDAAARKQEEQLAQHYLDTAHLGREVANHALLQALEDAKAGKLRDPSKTAQNAITASAIALDKRLILQERPTHIITDGNPLRTVGALARKLGITIDSTATEIPDAEPVEPNTQPLLSEGVSAKRARTREGKQPDTTSD